MKIRHVVLAAAVLLASAACKTSGASGRTASAATTQSSEAIASAQDSTAAVLPASDQAGTTGSGAAQGSQPTTPPGDGAGMQGDMGRMHEQMQQGQAGSGTGDQVAHEGDKTVSGKVSKISKDSITIRTGKGKTQKLKIVDQTQFEVDGQPATRADVRQGAEVRASYGEQDGQEVAVKVDAKKKASKKAPGKKAHGTSGAGAAGPGGGTGGDKK